MSTNPKDAIGLTKPALRLVPPALAIHVSQAMADGAKKYGAYNWRGKPVRLTVYIEAAMRHLYALLDGEDRARDSGHRHEAHVAACMAILLDARETGNLVDDRPPVGPAADLIDTLTAKPAPVSPAPRPVKNYDVLVHARGGRVVWDGTMGEPASWLRVGWTHEDGTPIAPEAPDTVPESKPPHASGAV